MTQNNSVFPTQNVYLGTGLPGHLSTYYYQVSFQQKTT